MYEVITITNTNIYTSCLMYVTLTHFPPRKPFPNYFVQSLNSDIIVIRPNGMTFADALNTLQRTPKLPMPTPTLRPFINTTTLSDRQYRLGSYDTQRGGFTNVPHKYTTNTHIIHIFVKTYARTHKHT